MFTAQKSPLTIKKNVAFTLLQKLLEDAHVPKLEGKMPSQTILFTCLKNLSCIFFSLEDAVVFLLVLYIQIIKDSPPPKKQKTVLHKTNEIQSLYFKR